ncbi:MAG: hypothetical protein ACW992_12005 [Candidatus Thorarchaeota archaeon]
MVDDELPSITQLKSIPSDTKNPFTNSLLGLITIIFEGRILCEMDRESLYNEVAWTHEFTEMALTNLMYSQCDGAYTLCRCDRNCGVVFTWSGIEWGFPICHFVSSVITSCVLPNKTGYERVEGDRVWSLVAE